MCQAAWRVPGCQPPPGTQHGKHSLDEVAMGKVEPWVPSGLEEMLARRPGEESVSRRKAHLGVLKMTETGKIR